MIFIDYYMNMDYYNDCWGGDMWMLVCDNGYYSDIYMNMDYYIIVT